MNLSLGRRRGLLVDIATAVVVAGCGSGSSSSSSSVSAGGSSATAGQSSAPAEGGYDLAGVSTIKINADAATVQVSASSGSSPVHVIEGRVGRARSKHDVAGSVASIASEFPGISFGDCHMEY